jgi:hypothetical protein
MRTEDQTITISDIHEQVIDALRDAQSVQERLIDVLSHLMRLREQSRQDAIKQRSEAVLNMLARDHLSIEGIARQFGTSPRSIRRIMDKARYAGDERVANRYNKSPSTKNSSLETSHAQGKDAPDPILVGDPAADSTAGLSRSGKSEEEGTEDRTGEIEGVEAQAGDEVGDASTEQDTVLAGTAAEGDETSDSSAAPEIVTIEHPFPFVTLGEAAERVVVVDLATEPDVHVEQVVKRTADDEVTFQTITETLRRTMVEEPAPEPAKPAKRAKPAPLVGPAGILVDVQSGVLSGTNGNLKVGRPVAKVLNHMADGGLYPIDLLAQKGGYPKAAMAGDMLKAWSPRLEQIGVTVVFFGKEIAKLQPAGA